MLASIHIQAALGFTGLYNHIIIFNSSHIMYLCKVYTLYYICDYVYVLCVLQIFKSPKCWQLRLLLSKLMLIVRKAYDSLNLCTEQQAAGFQSAHGQYKRFQKHHKTTEFRTCRAQWHNAPLLERPGKKLRNSFLDQHRYKGCSCLFTPFVTNISQAQLQKASFGLPEAGQANIKLRLPIRQLRTCFLDVSQDVKTKW